MQADTELKTICSKFFMDLNRISNEQDQIYYTVLYFIHTAPHLSMLYLKWTNLHPYEKFVLNTKIKPSLSKSGKIVYPPIIRAFEYWDIIQDTYGAPGFRCNPLRTELSEETDKEIANTMFIMDRTINQIRNKRELMTEFLTFKDPKNILCSYKWRTYYKNINKKRSYLTSTIDDEHNRPTDSRSEDDYVTDLNGCGDTTWYSDTD